MKRGERKGQAVEKRPPGEAERDAARAADREGNEPALSGGDPGKDRRGLSDMSTGQDPHDHGS